MNKRLLPNRFHSAFPSKGVAVLLVAVLFGCAMGVNRTFVHQDLRDEKVPLVVAVLPFENLSNNPTAGLSVSQLFATELMSSSYFCVLEESEMRRQLIGLKVDVDRLADVSIARDVGKGLFVDAVLSGSVSEFSYQHGLREEPAVGFNIQLVRIKDGVVLWRASQSLMGSGFMSRESIIETAQKAVRDTIVNFSDNRGYDPSRLDERAAGERPPPKRDLVTGWANETDSQRDRAMVYVESDAYREERLWLNRQARVCATLMEQRSVVMKRADEINKAKEREAKARSEAEKTAADRSKANVAVQKTVEDDLLELQLPPK
ncbi:MAG: hypothetical protein HQL81_06740 [Magnetococcales bacterium]|nr:hypothetical protein [Magnetococcales bacterium]MBF0630100.1 hypothetical protein [Magnetococcales bacterium]